MIHHPELECHAKGLVGYFQGQCHIKDSYDQNITVSAIFSELAILLLPNLSYHNAECLVKKFDCCVFDYCIQGQGHSKGLKCKGLSR